MQKQSSRDIVIVSEVWDFFRSGELSLVEVHIYAEISYFHKNGECFASNDHFAKLLQISTRHVQRILQKLKEKGFIKIQLLCREGTKEVEKRIITPLFRMAFSEDTPRHTSHDPMTNMSPPHDENVVTPHDQMVVTPHDENVVDKEQGIKQQDINNKLNNKNIRAESTEIDLPDQGYTKNGTPSPKPSSAQIDREFEHLWKLYPRKLGKKKALDSYKKARKIKKIPYETIENGLYRYISYLEQQQIEEQFIMHGSTWFNQEKWQDEYVSVQTRKKPKNAFEYFQSEYGGGNDESNRNGKVIDYYSEVIPQSFQGFRP